MHPAKHGFLFTLKSVLFREINDTEISIKVSKKMIWKNQCLPIFCIWRWNVPHEKKLIQFKDRRKFRFFLKPEVSSFTHAQLIWEQARERARKNLGWKHQFVRWFLLVGGFSGQLTIWWRQSLEVTFHFPSNARKIRPWALNTLAKFRLDMITLTVSKDKISLFVSKKEKLFRASLINTPFYHMTRMAPWALSLQNYWENPRMRAVRDGASRAGKKPSGPARIVKKKSQNYSQMKKFIILLETSNKQAPSRKPCMTWTYSKNFLMNVVRNEESLKLPRPSSDSLLCNFLHYCEEKGQTQCTKPDTMSSFSRSIQRYLEDNKAIESSISSKTRNSRSQEKSLNPSDGNLRSRVKGTNQMPQ